jgi:hypothetical protein
VHQVAEHILREATRAFDFYPRAKPWKTHGKPMEINGHNRKIGVDIGSIMVLESSRSNQQ